MVNHYRTRIWENICWKFFEASVAKGWTDWFVCFLGRFFWESPISWISPGNWRCLIQKNDHTIKGDISHGSRDEELLILPLAFGSHPKKKWMSWLFAPKTCHDFQVKIQPLYSPSYRWRFPLPGSFGRTGSNRIPSRRCFRQNLFRIFGFVYIVGYSWIFLMDCTMQGGPLTSYNWVYNSYN